MVVGLYRMLKRIRCDGACARGGRLLTRDCCGHGLQYYTTSCSLLDEILANLTWELCYQPIACWARFLPTSPVSYATKPIACWARFLPTSLWATLLASRCWARFLWTWLVSSTTSISLLNKFLVDLTCKLQTTSHSVVLAALLLETEWIRLGWDLEELPSFVKLVSLINEHFWFVVSLILYFLIGCCRNVNAVK